MADLETKIGDEIVLVDLDTVWAETFAHWDALVPTHVAESIATVTEQILRLHAAGEVGTPGRLARWASSYLRQTPDQRLAMREHGERFLRCFVRLFERA